MRADARTALLTIAALVGFALNSLLCRMALQPGNLIDPVSFTTIRIASGAITLLALAAGAKKNGAAHGSWLSGFALFIYAIAFSAAYVRLTTATGALILFTVVQLTMITAATRAGERLRPIQWAGLLLALLGLVTLCAPGLRAPHPLAALLMSAAGVAWGIYSLRGRGTAQPLANTAGNFLRALPFTLLITLATFSTTEVTLRGALLAIASGSVASGIGYSFWYAVVPRMTAARASVLQLSVPILATLGGFIILGEEITARTIVAAVATLGGIALTLKRRGAGASGPRV